MQKVKIDGVPQVKKRNSYVAYGHNVLETTAFSVACVFILSIVYFLNTTSSTAPDYKLERGQH